MHEMVEVFKRDGHTLSLEDKMVNFDDIKEILGLQDYLTLKDNFLE